MKKLTKRVKVGGMLLDVPLNATHVSADSFGMIKAHTAKPINVGMESWLCAGFDDFVCYIDLEGADWRECCWYVGDQVDGGDYFDSLVSMARQRAAKAMVKFPQPNYVLNKVAEESGEVIKSVIHFTEGRETWENVENELVDNLAMLIRLVTEGDQVIGFKPPEKIRSGENSRDQ